MQAIQSVPLRDSNKWFYLKKTTFLAYITILVLYQVFYEGYNFR